MELRLTVERLQELNHDQMDRVQKWWDKNHEGEPFLTTTDMIDLLGSMGVGVSIFVPKGERSSDGKVVVPDDEEELFLGMWGCLKESL
ncbi:hypothetical protein FHS19_003829 [Paenibacillus rhizosphaerae]|uniref:Uncharacterized protein n=1 Tax=Paenibacillus rhizosphaerae TaxID=297318 RepID=A0A839TQ78_9BACL|nr:hypothetical protein [Paenibacillus rhizosphaerae]MBB3129154.1 hypothetical protein [Paenibacillus rhizosphaerae]